ncbi:MAG TPA: PLP-dependent aminotransferase family protein [Brevundimonas sp.]|nr:PLP-dependent aminotransferase family protein [Brevundimonas sp.]
MSDLSDETAMTPVADPAPATRRALRMIRLDTDGEGTLQVRLYRTLRSAIARGLFALGTRLPSSRAMAHDLGISRNTVTATLDELIADGWIEARWGSGVYVLSERRAHPADASSDPLPDGPDIIPFDIYAPGLDFFPLDAWRRIQARRWSTMSPADLRDGAGAGYSALRRTIADHMWVARGVSCTPDQVIVTHSVTEGVDLVLRRLTRPGDEIWVENPGLLGYHHMFRAAGRRPVAVPVDGDGLDVRTARALSPNARAAVVSPQSQFPTCVTLSEERRSELLAWARENEAWIIEDDYDSEFRLDEGQPVPLAARAGVDRVIYAYSFSKALFPGLRVAFLVLPPGVSAPVIDLLRHTEGYPACRVRWCCETLSRKAGWIPTSGPAGPRSGSGARLCTSR